MHPSHHARTDPARSALITAESDNTLTYGDLDTRSNRGAHLLRSLGLGVGDPLHPNSRVAVAEPYRIPGYATLDLRAGFQADGERWRVMVFAKNVFDKYYIVNVIPGADTSARFAGQPATYGVTVGFKM